MTDNALVNKAAAATSPELTDKVVLYFIEHGMQILTAIALMGAGLFVPAGSGASCNAG